ncbi:MAG: hypothetical protein JF886_00950 [Candidatus Dormibacteraeota bacterium]|uniref:Uncharacterized protein n=1 Tax=Candidatus Aeolococcus gillhamiae TaxID=3127015 RepID=A0A934JT49_9BACT|nr:hypothetical protein [Candidatus Dormibacteraeota bacterium]
MRRGDKREVELDKIRLVGVQRIVETWSTKTAPGAVEAVSAASSSRCPFTTTWTFDGALTSGL